MLTAEDKELIIKEKELLLREKEALTWFSWNQLLISLIITFIVGGIAGVLGVIGIFGETIDKGFMITVIGAGYAGSDFIEGFMETKLQK